MAEPRRGTRRLLGVLAAGVAAVAALVACGGATEGTVVAKAQPEADYACGAGGTVTGPVAVPAWGTCAVPRCWRLVVRDGDGATAQPCVSREEYDRTPLGGFWHGRTDR